MKMMKKKMKRLLAALCCVALLVTGLSASNWMKDTALAGDVRGTISIATGDVGYTQSTGYINVDYTGMPSDYSVGADFLDKEFVNNYVTFGGGMTEEDLFDGKHIFYLATNGIIQYNWTGRTNPFEKGWTFTIAQGAKMPYMTTANEKAYVQLDAEYTYEVKDGRDGYECLFGITKQKVETFSLTTDLVGTGLEDGTGTLFHMTDSNVKNFQAIYSPMQSNEVYKDYIDFNGTAFDKWEEKGLRFRYVLDGGTKCIQIESWGTLRSELGVGDQVIFYEGMPIFYTGTDGTGYKAVLDATYIYECTGSNAEHNQVFDGIKYDTSHNVYGMKAQRYGTGTQGSEWYVNLTFDSASADTIQPGVYVSTDILTDRMAADYIDIAGLTIKQARNMGIIFRFIPTANVLQIAFGSEAVDTLEVGDKIVLKKGMPVFYLDSNGSLDSAVLDEEYTITVASKGAADMQLVCETSESYALSGEIGERKEEAGSYYYDVLFKGDMFTDANAQFQGDFADKAPLLENYFEVSGKTAEDLQADGWNLRRYNLPGVYVGLRFYCPTGNFDLTSGDYVMFKKGFPITYTATSGKTKTVYLDDDYGYLFNGSGFVYDSSIKPGDEDDKEEETQTVNKFGLDTPLIATYAEAGHHVANISITGVPFTFKNYLYQAVDGENIDFSGCKNASTVQNGLTAQITLASADVQVMQVKLTDEAVAALQVGDRIAFKKNTAFAYDADNAEAVAKLDNKYVLRVTAIEGGEVTFQVELTGTYGFAEVFYHSEEYMDVFFAPNNGLSDAVDFENVAISDDLMKEYLQIAEHTYEDLKAEGYAMSTFNLPAFRGVRISFQTFDLTAGTVLLLKEGLPITYTTTDGKTKTVYLDRTYGYTKNDQTAFVFDPNLTEIKATEYISVGLVDEAGSFADIDGSERFNLLMSNGIIEMPQYVQIDIMSDAKARELVKVNGFTTEQLLTAGFRIIFIPTAGVFQFMPGSMSWDDISKITLEQGMEISYYDNGPKKAVLDDTYVYKITKEPNRHVMTRVQDYKVTITVDGVEKLSGKYKVGTKLDLAQYANPSKGKVMTIKINGKGTQEKTLVVSEHADVVIENRSDLCVVVFKDGKETIVVKEYGLNDKNIQLPYAPDKNGYDDSWEEFKLANGVVTVNAIHTKRQTEPVVKISGVVADPEPEQSEGEGEGEVTSPQTSDAMNMGVWFALAIMAAIAAVATLLSKKRKTL